MQYIEITNPSTPASWDALLGEAVPFVEVLKNNEIKDFEVIHGIKEITQIQVTRKSCLTSKQIQSLKMAFV